MLGVGRRRLRAVTLGLFLAVGLLVAVASRVNGPGHMSPRDLLSDSALVGETLTVTGTVVSQGTGFLVLAPEDSSTPTISVAMVDAPITPSFGPGVIITVEGRLVRPRELEEAHVVTPTGPSKYVRPDSD